ncbi:hypothetical protein M422DRAFT_273453 [Sphaerobolus stellatus SS14]|uniref:DNA 3'-5' helicase n=1 Tax=Sphaerobolus stellatus (strain SS14) TaxID=990650 RepID=A0A0C9TUS1_SPHS4|nr:hypothetical protein M422DRAFT_273453 [Sphaerobolus stellatus SS14]
MPFVMPLFLEENKNKIVVILSPLNELERDQLDAFAPKLENDIKSRKYQVLITSPEMLLRHAPFRHVISNHKFSKDILAAVVDESHCIPQWGDKFRKENKNVGQMCSLFPSDVPVLATTATVSPEVVQDIYNVLNFDASKTYYWNMGMTDRISHGMQGLYMVQMISQHWISWLMN